MLIWAVASCAVIFGFLANRDASHRVSIRCRTIPANDQQLAKWYEAQEGVKDVSTSREGDTVNVTFTKRHGSFELLTPPLADLGYSGVQGMNTSIYNPSIIGGALLMISRIPVWIWFGASTVVAALVVRRTIRGKTTAGDQPVENLNART
jgi:hypothetical protein